MKWIFLFVSTSILSFLYDIYIYFFFIRYIPAAWFCMNKYDMRLNKFAMLLRRPAIFKIILKNIQETDLFIFIKSNYRISNVWVIHVKEIIFISSIIHFHDLFVWKRKFYINLPQPCYTKSPVLEFKSLKKLIRESSREMFLTG